MGVAMFAWHTPALYELALRSPAWHQTEHACFLLASLIFWWPVVQPWPSRVAMAPLGDGALSADRRPSEHRAVSDSCVLRSRAVSVVLDCATSVWILRSRRPGRRRRHHVGCRIACVCHTRSRHRNPVSVKAVTAKCELPPSGVVIALPSIGSYRVRQGCRLALDGAAMRWKRFHSSSYLRQ